MNIAVFGLYNTGTNIIINLLKENKEILKINVLNNGGYIRDPNNININIWKHNIFKTSHLICQHPNTLGISNKDFYITDISDLLTNHNIFHIVMIRNLSHWLVSTYTKKYNLKFLNHKKNINQSIFFNKIKLHDLDNNIYDNLIDLWVKYIKSIKILKNYQIIWYENFVLNPEKCVYDIFYRLYYKNLKVSLNLNILNFSATHWIKNSNNITLAKKKYLIKNH